MICLNVMGPIFMGTFFPGEWQHCKMAASERELAMVFIVILCLYRRSAFDAAALKNRNHLPSLDSLRWRVDVAISTR